MKKITLSLFMLMAILMSSCDKPLSLAGSSWTNKDIQSDASIILMFNTSTDLVVQTKWTVNEKLQNKTYSHKYSYDGSTGEGIIVSGSITGSFTVKKDVLTLVMNKEKQIFIKD